LSRTGLRGVRLCLVAQASHHSGLPLNADVEAVEKPVDNFFLKIFGPESGIK